LELDKWVSIGGRNGKRVFARPVAVEATLQVGHKLQIKITSFGLMLGFVCQHSTPYVGRGKDEASAGRVNEVVANPVARRDEPLLVGDEKFGVVYTRKRYIWGVLCDR
jgi:hypothetical protein